MEAILDNIPVGIFLLDSKRNVVYKNRAANEMGDVMAIMANNFENIHKIGERFYRGKKISMEEGDLIIVEDVTEKVMAENALRESESRYRALSENAFMGIIVFDGKKITYVNRRMKEIVGYGKQYIQRKFFELVHPDDVNKFEDVMNGKPQQIRIFDEHGNIRWLEMACVDVEENGFKMFNIIDITRRKEMEDKLKDANERMQKVLEKERKFLEEVSHYFFNPLCIAKGYLELSIPNADPALRKKLETTKQAVIRVENVVKHIVMEGKIYE
ncbi:MAG: PAS domain S-box protein [Thermoplasmata archaeon]|nr:PAS domain S-box protein [Thermoplasmata archaeon]